MIQVLLFARLRDELGTGVVNLEIPSPARISDVRTALCQQFPQHSALLAEGKALVAINQNLTNDEQASVSDRDEVALFPPMTGG